MSTTTATITLASKEQGKFPPYAYTPTEDRQLPLANPVLPPLFDGPTTWSNFVSRVNWFQSILLTSTPLLAIYLASQTHLQTKTMYWSLLYYLITGLGITAGYHRYWAHRSYDCTPLTRIGLCLAGSGAFQGSIHWWSRGHRAHHRWTDSDKDPYAAPRGFFFSHIGWMLINRPKNRIGYADTADLKADPLVRFQHRYYLYFAVFMAFVFPCLVAGLLWGDYKGGFVYAGLCRLVFIHHATFCVNSLAHYIGENPFDDYHTPKDSWITAIVTCGEGYHNFHHEFPQDYRNAILWHQYDPTKWLIKGLSFFGLTYNLKTFSSNEIEKGKVQMMEKKVDQIKKTLTYGKLLHELPVYTMEEFQARVNQENKKWILLDGMIYDVEHFDHPGGAKYLFAGIGKDMTKSFNGGIYNHSNGARNLLSSMRVGVIKDAIDLSKVYSRTDACAEKAAEYDGSLEPEKRKTM
ncbi:delta-9 desaturase [Gilbertella persicaria]|uniref:delta-9 desaturase n=1 Tax=Gilbertella persicaria TaxID=101096 RepID=UPI00221E3BE3|nr:delta-9 desaturase [Gilbertella persicaria]KAI8082603.1 delta-9 desaturase [Gilbertella persicaria]